MSTFDATSARKTAQEARHQAEARMEIELEELLGQIQEAAGKGEFKFMVYEQLDKYIIHRLKELGYDIINNSQYNEVTYQISW